MVPNSGAAANLVCFKCLERRNSILDCRGVSRAEALLASARFKFGDGRLGEVRVPADIPGGLGGVRGNVSAFELEADIPAFLRKGAAEALVGAIGCHP